MLYRNEPVFDDSNYQLCCGDGQRIVVAGEEYFLSATPPTPEEEAMVGMCSTPFEMCGIELIPESDWSAMLKDQIARKARVSDFCTFPAYDQSRTNYCWINGPCQAMTTQRLIQGLPLKIISSASAGCLIKGYRNVGGNEVPGIKWLAEHGAATVDLWPNAAIDERFDTEASRAQRVHYKPLEWINSGSDHRKYATMALLTVPGAFAYYWMSHVMMMCDLVEIERGSFGFRVRNSWRDSWGAKNEHGFGGFATYRIGSRGTPNSGFHLRQVTASRLAA